MVGFTQSLAKEVGAQGIRVNCVCPGFVRTSMQERELEWEAGLRGMKPDAVRAEYVALTPLGRIEEPGGRRRRGRLPGQRSLALHDR